MTTTTNTATANTASKNSSKNNQAVLILGISQWHEHKNVPELFDQLVNRLSIWHQGKEIMASYRSA